ncbi:GNAT family N-acetyltransferase [Brachybacterium ginsengisoli]|uniref:GNAT family N-acetyltransferase n=1 Tax=Brachybacterium ginsengisoli TaxID=1331682 RepID=A0A291GVW6_9MICO|nr:GNAT family N-acetyltransferase [Brachybacterium ginsengisoli]ATG54234.1 GNAT family N-acetyltransferase [Brachybacterium ginsengisoli]
MDILDADLDDPVLLRFLQEHLDDLAPTAPTESRHALDAEALRRSGVRMWVAAEEGAVLGTVALAEVGDAHEELKSMRTSPDHRGRGIAARMLSHAVEDARRRGVERISLETGSADFFAAARSLYRRAGFLECEPFGAYVHDPHSVFMTTTLQLPNGGGVPVDGERVEPPRSLPESVVPTVRLTGGLGEAH